MINHISIRDFAIIENTEVDFSSGLSVITGETGSGKSIVVTAISLALGSRADSSYVRHGEEKAIVELAGDLNGEDIVITREVSSSGKNLCKLNGRMVTLSELSETCSLLADIHGQYDNQSLLNPDNHLSIVDKYKWDKVFPILNNYKKAYDEYTEVKHQLNNLLSMEADNTRKLDFYKYEIKEIDEANLKQGEYKEIKERLSLLQNGEKIFASANKAYEFLNGNDTGYGSSGAFSLLGNAVNEITSISRYSEEIANMESELNDAYYKLEDLTERLRNLIDSINFSPQELDTTIERISLLEGLIKKYGDSSEEPIETILAYRNSIASNLEKIENFDEEKKQLTHKLELSKKKMIDLGEELTAARQVSAADLQHRIVQELKNLNFEDAELEISFKECEPSSDGMDEVEILISTNKGEPLKPLVKTASGGEISRIMLAIKGIIAAYDNIPTLIFDEIDQGISGKTAAVVGKKLKEIAKHHQVICITHLPQIAAISDTSYRIYKDSDSSSTYTHVQKLTQEEKVNEVARLIGGETITEAARAVARELIAT